MGQRCSRRSVGHDMFESNSIPTEFFDEAAQQMSSWMGWYLGATEAEMISSRSKFFDNMELVHAQTGRRWPVGNFEYPTVAELTRRISDVIVGDVQRDVVRLTVVDSVDVGSLQASLLTSDCAMVQIASNFNCLEVPSRVSPPHSGRLVTKYAVDKTQGPAASFGVPAASIYRAHYVFHSVEKPQEAWGQTSDCQVELLDNVDAYFGRCVNGKLTLNGDEQIIDDSVVADVSKDIRVGIHSDAQVVFGRSSPGRLLVLPEPFQLVDQVLSASVALPSPGKAQSDVQLNMIMRTALRACYDGAYAAAIARKRKLLLLTLVGGGVFGNPEDAILQEIASAHKRWAKHPGSSLCEVRVCVYQAGAAARVQKALDDALV